MVSRNRLARWSVLLAATLAVPLAATVTVAQVQVNQTGQARDANPRVGSGGLNTRPPNLQLYTAEDVALGRVTGGRAFRGDLTGDPTQPFGGRSNLPSDRFARQANLPVTPATPMIRPGQYAVPFYPATTAVSPQSGDFRLNTYTGQYVFRPPTALGAEDIQYGLPPGTPVIRPSARGGEQLVMPATVRDLSGNTALMVITATPLLGVRPMPGLLDEDRFLLARSGASAAGGPQVLDAFALRRLREQRDRTLLSPDALAERARVGDGGEAAAVAPPLVRAAELGSAALGQPAQTPAQVETGRIEPPRETLGARPLVTPPPPPDPAERNPLLAELRRIEEARRARQAAGQAERAEPARPLPPRTVPTPPDAPAQPADPSNPTPAAPAAPPGVPSPADPVTPAEPSGTLSLAPAEVRARAGLQIRSLAEQYTDEGLKELVTSAEKLVAEGRFASAIDRYEAARKFAAADPTLLIGRAHAELGGGFYARALTSLQQALAADPASLGGRHDLRTAFPAGRADTVIDDLKRMAVDDRTDPMPVTLLAYIAYHTGDAGRAVELLTEAHRRRPGDPLVTHLLDLWAGGEGK